MLKARFGSIIAVIAMATGLQACSATTTRSERTPTQALPDTTTTQWGRQFAGAMASHPGLSGFHIIQAGLDGLSTRIQLIRGAQRTLDLQYFIFRGDAAGSRIREELLKAADRGVRVRVLVDDGDTMSGDEGLLLLDGHRDMNIRVFNPFTYRGHNRILRNLEFVLRKSRLDYRMHNKLLVADNSIALVGGRNVGDQYFQVDPKSQYADDDVFVVGDTVRALSKTFDEFWNSDLAISAGETNNGHRSRERRIYGKQLSRDADLRVESDQPLMRLLSDPAQLTWASADVLYDSPEKRVIERQHARGKLMSGVVERQIGATEHDLIMVSPYFVPSEREETLLKEARGRLARVRVLTNSLESNPEIAAHSGYAKLRVPLLKAGAELYEVRGKLDSVRGSGQGAKISQYGNYALHGKMYVFDVRRLFLGSWNYDQRSLRLNTEIGVLIDSPILAAQVRDRFDAMVSPKEAYQVMLTSNNSDRPGLLWKTEIDGNNQVLTSEPSRGLWPRVKAKILAWLPLQPEL